ncbi:MAG: FkbM family methyltransferase [Proteobacteria bacterium]|nr:FkbM family methyltransferase [Pseudomonadota bacterium]
MSLREGIRRLRLYYKSSALFRGRLASPSVAVWLPLLPGKMQVEMHMASGRRFRIRASCWPLLPTACRLDGIGAEFEFLDDAKRVTVDGLTLYSPLWSRDEASYYKEVLIDDAYGVKHRDLTGQVVVDVGAYVGDSTIAFARRGATVHAFEPSVAFCGFIRRNLDENSLAQRVTLHEVGLSDRADEVAVRNDRLRFVEGVAYALEHLPQGVDLLKLDCEGAEYHLLADPRFLAHLRPREIRMEYHRGPQPVSRYIADAGYTVQVQPGSGPVGLLSAQRKG